jgi:hypothetical protein
MTMLKLFSLPARLIQTPVRLVLWPRGSVNSARAFVGSTKEKVDLEQIEKVRQDWGHLYPVFVSKEASHGPPLMRSLVAWSDRIERNLQWIDEISGLIANSVLVFSVWNSGVVVLLVVAPVVFASLLHAPTPRLALLQIGLGIYVAVIITVLVVIAFLIRMWTCRAIRQSDPLVLQLSCAAGMLDGGATPTAVLGQAATPRSTAFGPVLALAQAGDAADPDAVAQVVEYLSARALDVEKARLDRLTRQWVSRGDSVRVLGAVLLVTMIGLGLLAMDIPLFRTLMRL